MKLFALLFAVLVALVATCAGLKNDICGLPHSKRGRCFALMPSWSYNADAGKCVHFNYGGCGGNANLFDTKSECEKKCKE